MVSQKNFSVFGYASGIAAGDSGCAAGPLTLRYSPLLRPLFTQGRLQWQAMLYPQLSVHKIAVVAEIAEQLAQAVRPCLDAQQLFLILGGDHSSAIGTWSAASVALRPRGPIGLIWIDAHLDSHTFATTESGNIHGMPLAALLGHGEAAFTALLEPRPKLLPQHVCVIGARSYESGELALLERLKVRIYPMAEINQRGLATVWQEALALVNNQTTGYGISLDLDSIDATQAPGVSNPEPDGLKAEDLKQVLGGSVAHPQLLGIEIVEFNPYRDQGQATETLIKQLIEQLLSCPHYGLN